MTIALGAVMLVVTLVATAYRRIGRRPANVEIRMARYLRAGYLPSAAYRRAMEELAHRPVRHGVLR